MYACVQSFFHVCVFVAVVSALSDLFLVVLPLNLHVCRINADLASIFYLLTCLVFICICVHSCVFVNSPVFHLHACLPNLDPNHSKLTVSYSRDEPRGFKCLETDDI